MRTIFVPCRYLPNAKHAHQTPEFVRKRHADTDLLRGKVACKAGLMMIFNGIRYTRSVLMEGVIVPHDALQLEIPQPCQ
jgi:hypothetical protein